MQEPDFLAKCVAPNLAGAAVQVLRAVVGQGAHRWASNAASATALVAGGSAGVRPPSRNHSLPSTTASPAASMLMATPETTWLPRWLIEA